MSRALIIVDMLNDFVLDHGSLKVPGVEHIVDQVAVELAKARAADDLVVFVCDSHEPDDLEFERYPPHAVSGTSGEAIIDELAPAEGEMVVTKRRLGPFFETNLHELLAEAKIDQATVVGVCTHICVMETVSGLCDRDIKITVPAFAVADIDPEMEAAAFKRMAGVFGATIIPKEN